MAEVGVCCSWLMLVKDPGNLCMRSKGVTQQSMQIITRSSAQRLDLSLECLSFPTSHSSRPHLRLVPFLKSWKYLLVISESRAIDFLTFPINA
jgi:hypothetical protein